MITKTESALKKMDYLLSSKESGGNPVGIMTEICRDLSDIYGNQVKNGLKSPEEIENFKNTLPGTESFFDKPQIHSGLSILQPRFEELVKVSITERHIESQNSHAKVA